MELLVQQHLVTSFEMIYYTQKKDYCIPSYDLQKGPCLSYSTVLPQSETELSSSILIQFVGKGTHTSNRKLSENKILFLFVLLK